MSLPIDRDANRFRQIVKGKVRENLRKYIKSSEMIGRKGKDIVSIPIPEIELPHFRFGEPKGGTGQGEGEIGEPIGAEPGDGDGKAGDAPGSHILEVELTLEELAELLGEELELPRIKPKGKNNVTGEILKYTGARKVGPESLRYFKRTFMQALRRELISGVYNPDDPVIVPIQDDKRYRSWRYVPLPESNAVVFYMLDISGSMSDQKKEIVRLTAFWIDTWLSFHYKNIISRYIVHDTKAYEVEHQHFYSLRESGGTHISSAYELCNKIIVDEYNPEDWNLYGFHFSDGENFESDDKNALELLDKELLPKLNLFCYGQVQSPYGYYTTQFANTLDKNLKKDNLIIAKINNHDEILSAIKKFLGKGL